MLNLNFRRNILNVKNTNDINNKLQEKELFNKVQSFLNQKENYEKNIWGIRQKSQLIPLGCLNCSYSIYKIKDFLNRCPTNFGKSICFCENCSEIFDKKYSELMRIIKIEDLSEAPRIIFNPFEEYIKNKKLEISNKKINKNWEILN
jgi:hypothetical protein